MTNPVSGASTALFVATHAQAMADQVRHADIDAALLWLRHASVSAEGRQRLAARILTSSLWTQAGLLGLVLCTRCGDRGCDWCRGGL